MWLDNDSQDAVDLFWQLCGESEPFPRTLERSILLALPIALIKLPRLRLIDIESWIKRRGIAFRFDYTSRLVRGCLVAFGGKGLIFVDGTDPDSERRFTLAHEVAHFLMDYWQPREHAIRKLGASIVEVIDGIRLPSVNERVYSLLSSVPTGVHVNLLDRDNSDASSDIWKIENRADKVALALLAPPDEVLVGINHFAAKFDQRHADIIALLESRFGMPASIASVYGWSLLEAVGKGPSWLEGMRIK
ncbi:hypothetical protein ANRL1_04442 [Anaerolineae bacterium]|nr:hypothetical protein ANRL1_04442 [Anaerolineae bacterium]